MYWELFWAWLRKGYLAVVIGNVFMPVPLWAVIVAAIALALVVNTLVAAMSNKRCDSN